MLYCARGCVRGRCQRLNKASWHVAAPSLSNRGPGIRFGVRLVFVGYVSYIVSDRVVTGIYHTAVEVKELELGTHRSLPGYQQK
jgi:hypothetical protein